MKVTSWIRISLFIFVEQGFELDYWFIFFQSLKVHNPLLLSASLVPFSREKQQGLFFEQRTVVGALRAGPHLIFNLSLKKEALFPLTPGGETEVLRNYTMHSKSKSTDRIEVFTAIYSHATYCHLLPSKNKSQKGNDIPRPVTLRSLIFLRCLRKLMNLGLRMNSLGLAPTCAEFPQKVHKL